MTQRREGVCLDTEYVIQAQVVLASEGMHPHRDDSSDITGNSTSAQPVQSDRLGHGCESGVGGWATCRLFSSKIEDQTSAEAPLTSRMGAVWIPSFSKRMRFRRSALSSMTSKLITSMNALNVECHL